MIINTFLIISLNIPVFLIVPKVKSLQNNTGTCMITLAMSDTALGVMLIIILMDAAVRGTFVLNIPSVLCTI